MTGSELRQIMKARKLSSRVLAEAWGCHPQTIRNLWAKAEVPRLHQLALDGYLIHKALDTVSGVDGAAAPKRPKRAKTNPFARKETITENKEAPSDPWARLK